MHTVAPNSEFAVPGAQATQVVPLLYVDGSHNVQAAAPGSDMDPLPQGVQTDAFAAPYATEYVPASQGTHCAGTPSAVLTFEPPMATPE